MVVEPLPGSLDILKQLGFVDSPTAHLSDLQGSDRDRNRTAILDFLCALLDRSELPARLFNGNGNDNDYSKWTIDGDPSI
ncbi:hypothetical protein MY11210_009316 [Beauveria gryllotalpidicola]